MIKRIIRFLFILFFRVEVKGLENYHEAGKRVLIIANHQSFLDSLLIAAFLPDKPMFAVNSFIASRWYFKPFFALVQTFCIDPTSPMATRSIISEIRKDKKCMIFPEGRISTTGSMMKIYKGSAMIADKSEAKILPIRIEGAQYSFFSKLKGIVRRKLFPKITLTILPPRDFKLSGNLMGRERIKSAGNKLEDMMSNLLFETSDYKKTLFDSLLEQIKIHGRKHLILEDFSRKPINYGQFLVKCFALGSKIKDQTQKKEHVGILLPNAIGGLVTFFALQICGRIPAMLNFSTGTLNMLSVCETAKIKIVYTSRNFVEKANLLNTVSALEKEKINIYYLEDLAEKITFFDKINALTASFFPKLYYEKNSSKEHDSSAVILFTSGSEGKPKAVVLSHENILANIAQVAARIDFNPKDTIFNALPIFHSFGLTAGTLLPLLSGIKIFLYPSPLHYRTVPELIYDSSATIMFGTDTFLANYAKYAHVYDFYSLRYVFAGAEKLKDSTRTVWAEKFGIRIFEGYGATETAPVLSLNTPMHNKLGTVGRLMPSISYAIEKVEGIENGGRLIVQGPNVMKGYLLSNNPGVLVPTLNNTYDTGDIVEIDNEGYISIMGRAKRFAKIAGEMISLSAVEMYIGELWENYNHAVISIADAKKGEALILVTDYPKANRKDLTHYATEHGLSELSIPKTIKFIDKIPLLGTGKIDYVSLQKII